MLGKNKGDKMGVSEENVLAALSTVIEPELHCDLVSLNMVRDLKVEDSNVSFTIMLTTPACLARQNGRGCAGGAGQGGRHWRDSD